MAGVVPVWVLLASDNDNDLVSVLEPSAIVISYRRTSWGRSSRVREHAATEVLQYHRHFAMELDDSRRTLSSIASGGAITDDTCRLKSPRV